MQLYILGTRAGALENAYESNFTLNIIFLALQVCGVLSNAGQVGEVVCMRFVSKTLNRCPSLINPRSMS